MIIFLLNGLQSKQDSFYDKIRLDGGPCDRNWSFFFRHYDSFAKVCDLPAKFSEDLNAKAATMSSQECCLPSQTTLLRCSYCSPTEALTISPAREPKSYEGAPTHGRVYFPTNLSGDNPGSWVQKNGKGEGS